jgi:DNA-binding transcriptional ArsR family regulator
VSRTRDPFGAVADPTRRAILELLAAEEHMTAGEIAAEFPDMSRPAVSKHLAVLRDAELVAVQTSGREQHYSIDAQPLADIYFQWLQQFAPLWEDSLRRLKRNIERD